MRNNKMSRYYNDYLQHSDEDTLAHFGIPGMKRGQRKIQEHIALNKKIREEKRIAKLDLANRRDKLKKLENRASSNLKNIRREKGLAEVRSAISAEKQMKKKYGKEYIKQRDARERKKIILGLVATAGLAAYTNYKLKHYPIYSNTKKF